jgi:hypothetical protein
MPDEIFELHIFQMSNHRYNLINKIVFESRASELNLYQD